MLVLAMMNEARKPSNWQWLWAASQAPAEASPGPIDTKVTTPAQNLPPDGFTVAPSSQPPAVLAAPNEGEFLPGIDHDLLARIEDNTVLRVAENEAWYTMLGLLAERTQDELVSLSTATVAFAQLFRQTDVYRGKLVTVEGTTRRVEAIQPRSNDRGIDELYRWILAPRGGSNSPLVIYSLEKPEGIPLGEQARHNVKFTGFCFKRWAYAAGDGTRLAPLILAKTVTWKPKPASAAPSVPSASVLIYPAICLVGLAALVALCVYRSSVRERPEVKRLRHSANAQIGGFDEDAILPGTETALRQIAESDQADEDASE